LCGFETRKGDTGVPPVRGARDLLASEIRSSGLLTSFARAFIPRFNARRKAKELSETESDMALIAAALGFAPQTKVVAGESQTDNLKPSRWVMAGRRAAFSNRI
jgi:hypothetical protein